MNFARWVPVAERRRRALAAIENQHVLLVFPIKGREDIPSLWKALHPRSTMRWEWDQDGDQRVADLWRLREELSRSGQVVYAKWFRGRATFFSRQAFVLMLAFLGTPLNRARLTGDSVILLDALEADAPLSTKKLKEAADLQGRSLESAYQRAMKPLWESLWIVGFGEVEDSSFPSLAIGPASGLFEDLWNEAGDWSESQADQRLSALLGDDSPFLLFARQIKSRLV